MSLQVQYRPKSFKTFIGNEEVVESLKLVLDRENPPSAFLFTGGGGTGKTTIGRIVRRELGCHVSDFREINASDDTGVDGIRKVIESVKYAPLSGNRKVILYDEAHMLSKSAQEAMLKVLEEPPEYVTFIICTTNPEALKQTFKRRCHHYDLNSLKRTELSTLCKRVLKAEKVKYRQKIVSKICSLADGSAGQALKLLDQVIDFTDEEKAIEVLQSTGVEESELIIAIRTLLNDSIKARTKWVKISKVLKNIKTDGEGARRAVLAYLSKVLLNNGSTGVALMMEHFENNFYDSGKSGLILAFYKACFDLEDE